jgi:hypothetical protein
MATALFATKIWTIYMIVQCQLFTNILLPIIREGFAIGLTSSMILILHPVAIQTEISNFFNCLWQGIYQKSFLVSVYKM